MDRSLIAVALAVPAGLSLLAWLACRRPMNVGWVVAGVIAGGLATVGLGRLSGFLDGALGAPGATYGAVVRQQWLGTALPEEWGKGLIAVLLWRLARRPAGPLGWMACAASAHAGFAAVEGLFGALGHEGMAQVLLGRSLGAASHVSWGLLAAVWLHRAAQPSTGRWLWMILGLFGPATLHALGNAALADHLPGPDDPRMLIRLATELLTWGLAAASLWRARRAGKPGTSPLRS